MIVDVHYHYMRLPADDNIARMVMRSFLEDAARTGMQVSLEDTEKLYRDYLDDPNYDKLIARMDECGVDVSVVNVVDSFGRTNSEVCLRYNENCAKAVARHPGRLIGMAGVDPRRPDAPAILRRCITEFNMKGLKWHPDQGYYPDSKEAYEVLAVANEFEIPLLTHCSPLSNSRAKFAHPMHLDDIALDFPKVNIIAAHSGNLWWREWAALAQYKKNIVGDLAMWQVTAISKPVIFRRYLREILDIIGPEQILWASDGPCFEPVVSNKKWIEIIKGLTVRGTDGIVFSQEEVDAILGGNAARVFKLKSQ